MGQVAAHLHCLSLLSCATPLQGLLAVSALVRNYGLLQGSSNAALQALLAGHGLERLTQLAGDVDTRVQR